MASVRCWSARCSLDLFQLHSPPAEVVAGGEWAEALERMKRDGKVRYYGISVGTIEAGQAALSYPGISSLQFVIACSSRARSRRSCPARASGASA